MNNQLRLTAVFIGALAVAASFTFPLWQQYLSVLPGGAGVVLPCLPPQATESFLLLEDELREELLTVADETPELACELIFAHLGADDVVPAPQQEIPEDLLGRIRVGNGNFVPATPGVRAEGALSVFELADGRHLIRLDDVDVTNVSDMTLWLSANAAPTTIEEVQAGNEYQLIDPLLGNVGGQNYIIAADVDLSSYNSVVVLSEELNIVVSYATLIQF